MRTENEVQYQKKGKKLIVEPSVSNTGSVDIRKRLSPEKSVSSVAGGHDEVGQRYKMAGFYGFTPEVFVEADKEFETLGLKYNHEQRVTLRGFEEGDVFKTVLEGIKHGFILENIFYSPHYTEKIEEDGTLKKHYHAGYVILMSKNGRNRPKIGDEPILEINSINSSNSSENCKSIQASVSDIINYQSLVENDLSCKKILDLKRVKILENAKILNNYDAELKINSIQIQQLAERWKNIFNDTYDAEIVTSIIRSINIPKVIIVDNDNNIKAAAIAEEDNYGNFEITEVFSDMPGGGSILIRKLVEQITAQFPRHRIFMEANTMSGMWKIAINEGFRLSQEKIPTLQNGRIIANVKVRQSDIGNSENNKYKNFVTLFYNKNLGSYAPSNELK